MFHQIRCELRVLRQYIGLIVFISFFAAFCGVLLWVNGTSAPLVFRVTNMPSIAPGFTICFLLWLVVYALTGLQIAGILTTAITRKCKTLHYVTLGIISYIFLLSWYPLFFSVVHTLFAAIILVFAIVLQVHLQICFFKKMLVMIPVFIIQILLEGYFLLITVTYMTIN